MGQVASVAICVGSLWCLTKLPALRKCIVTAKKPHTREGRT